MEVRLYRCVAENNRVDKTPNKYMTLVDTREVIVKDATDLLEPVLIIDGYDKPYNMNYVYIKHWNRFYYVTKVVEMPYKRVELHLSVDVLNTYRDGIKALQCVISRQENVKTGKIIDATMPIEQEKDIVIRLSTGTPFTKALGNDANSVVITTTGAITVTPTSV